MGCTRALSSMSVGYHRGHMNLELQVIDTATHLSVPVKMQSLVVTPFAALLNTK